MQTMKDLLKWVDEVKNLCQPDRVYWLSGSKEEEKAFYDELVSSGKAIQLNPLLRPNSYAFFSDPSDVARVEKRTFIASKKAEDAGPTNNWIEPNALKKTMTSLYKGSMKGRTMYVIPYMMGPLHSEISKAGIEITDSLYVVVNMIKMTRVGYDVIEEIKQGKSFIPGLHSVGAPLENNEKDVSWPCAPIEHKYIAHFPEERLILSYGSGYGGNALLGKKCLALRIASKIAKDEGWMAEHMLILKITNPEGKFKYILGAFPSACGKTNLSMLVPTISGWKVETVGDDIAWIWRKKDGKLYAINPEKGFFGVAKGTSYKSNPNAMKAIEKNTIFTNVALTDDLDVWWEGIDQEKPKHLKDWQQQDHDPSMKIPAAHPNSRFTTEATESPVLAKEWDDPEGVLISAILVGGRRPSTIPLVHESLSWNHGVFMGSMMGSEITAATISDDIGRVRRDPFAMLPFIGYHVGDYLNHWIDMGKDIDPDSLPKIYYVNWFRKDAHGNFLWPGFGENSRVLKWIFERVDKQATAKLTPIGYIPELDSLDLSGLNITKKTFKKLTDVNVYEWLKEVDSIRIYYQTIGQKLPLALEEELNHLKHRLKMELYEMKKHKMGCYLSPIGHILYEHENHHLYGLSIEEDFHEESFVFENDDMIEHELSDYFHGDLKNFDVDVVFEKGTDFQKRVWNQLLQIPFGQTKSYQDIANAVGNPKAVRAVGQACKKNPVGIVVPCHRVIGKNNKLTGYSGKHYIHLKKKLLDMEKAFLR
ncbi:phosphoenolpyruvate carboxykinase [Tenericutes bacterium MZ-XQ]|nr:phosphoenolpyruvate carboxykinase [Tenericutes bacterium MZ-XQ]